MSDSPPTAPLTGVLPPVAVSVWPDPAGPPVGATGDAAGLAWRAGGTSVALVPGPDGAVAVDVTSPGTPVAAVEVCWRTARAADLVALSRILGDAFERSYGDLGWLPPDPDRRMYWYWLGHDPDDDSCVGMGVRVRPAAFCSWTVDPERVRLRLDLRSGSGPVLLGDRTLRAAEVVRLVTGSGSIPWQALNDLVAALATGPAGSGGPDGPAGPGASGRSDGPGASGGAVAGGALSCGPLVGTNNWYYAYGRGFDGRAVLRDADLAADLAGDHPVRPFCVVDDGWQRGGQGTGGPWDGGLAGVFDDLPALAGGIRERGARPGVWFRPLLSRVDGSGRLVRRDGGYALDPSHPDALATVAADTRRLTGWGFELLKHDFSTYDLFGAFGPPTPLGTPGPTGGAGVAGGRVWRPHDTSLTNAEILLRLYRTVREAAGGAVVLGCNTVGHLAAGLVEAQRTGDDTSGHDWARTRRMGVNTLAHRLPQHGRFFVQDADCVPCTPQTPWPRNREFLDLVARSGTALFVSVDPQSRTAEVDRDLRAAFTLALDGGQPGGVRPLDWQQTPTPQRWRTGRAARTYHWDPQ
jgi:alpha-galactosidase